jgi:hypothetical protein
MISCMSSIQQSMCVLSPLCSVEMVSQTKASQRLAVHEIQSRGVAAIASVISSEIDRLDQIDPLVCI